MMHFLIKPRKLENEGGIFTLFTIRKFGPEPHVKFQPPSCKTVSMKPLGFLSFISVDALHIPVSRWVVCV